MTCPKKLIKRWWLFRSVHPVSFGLIEHMNPFTKEFSKTPAAVLVLNFHYQCKFHGHFAKLWREDSTLSDFLCLSKEITFVPVISGHYILNRSQFVHHMIKEYLAEVMLLCKSAKVSNWVNVKRKSWMCIHRFQSDPCSWSNHHLFQLQGA